MNHVSFVSRTIALAATVVLMAPAAAFAQAEHQHETEQQAQGKMENMSKKMEQMKAKMGSMNMDDMAAKKKANTERLNALMAQMKNARGEAKVAAMADVITVLLEERAAMQDHCATMKASMMGK